MFGVAWRKTERNALVDLVRSAKILRACIPHNGAFFLRPDEWRHGIVTVIPQVIFQPQQLHPVIQRTRRTARLIACSAFMFGTAAVAEDEGAVPQPLSDGEFDALVANPPFSRSLGVSDSLILTGVARFGADVVATLLDTQTLESQVVSRTPNFHGWQLIGLEGTPSEMRTWRARIQIPGGEIVAIRYQKPPPASISKAVRVRGSNLPPINKAQSDEARNAAVNYKEGFSSDGYPRQPPPEMVARLSRLSVSQREEINRQMFGLRNQGLGLNERRKVYEGLVDHALQSRR